MQLWKDNYTLHILCPQVSLQLPVLNDGIKDILLYKKLTNPCFQRLQTQIL
jgi:hypothetical protein